MAPVASASEWTSRNSAAPPPGRRGAVPGRCGPCPVAAGGAALFQADHAHTYRNDGDRPVELVMVVVQPDADLDNGIVAYGWTQGALLVEEQPRTRSGGGPALGEVSDV